jgi:hypothetical protein
VSKTEVLASLVGFSKQTVVRKRVRERNIKEKLRNKLRNKITNKLMIIGT